MTLVCGVLLAVAVASSVWNPHRIPLLVVGAAGRAAVMLGVMVLPDFSNVAGAAVTLCLALLVATCQGFDRVLPRREVAPDRAVKRQGRTAGWRKFAIALALVDLVFMAITMLLVPEHGASPPGGVAPVGGNGHGASHPAVAGGGLMLWLTLLAWVACAAVLSVPSRHRRAPGGAFHIVCSGSMIAAMAAMAL